MQIFLVTLTCLCVTVSTSGYANYGDSIQRGHVTSGNNQYGNGRYGSNGGLVDNRSYDKSAHNYGKAGNKFDAHGNNYYRSNDHADAKGDAAKSLYGHRNSVQANKDIRVAGHDNRAAYNDDNVHNNFKREGGSKTNARNNHNDNSYYRQGTVFNSGVAYAFDKKYNNKKNDNGDFEIIDNDSARNLDEYRDRISGYKTQNRKHKNRKHVDDNSYARRKSNYGQGKSKSSYGDGKHGSAANHAVKDDGARRAYGEKLNEATAGDTYQADAYATASNKYDDIAGRNAYHGNNAAVSKNSQRYGKYDGLGVSRGLLGNGYGNKYRGYSGYNNDGYHGNDHHVNRYESAGNGAHSQTGSYGSKLDDSGRHKAGSVYNRNGRRNHHGDVYYNSGVGAKNNEAYRNNNDSNSANAYAYDNANADRNRRYGKGAAATDSADDSYSKDNYRRHYVDGAKNHHRVKKFHRHSDSDGKNYERMTYNKKNFKDSFGQNKKSAHHDANKTLQKYNKDAAAAVAHHDSKHASDHTNNAYNRYNAANAAKRRDNRKSNYYGRNADHNAGSQNADNRKVYSDYDNAESVRNHQLSNYAQRSNGDNAHVHNNNAAGFRNAATTNGARPGYGGARYAQNGAGSGIFGQGIGNTGFVNSGNVFRLGFGDLGQYNYYG